MPAKNLDIANLKEFASKHLDDPLRTLILSEEDKLSVDEFMVKTASWLKLLRIQRQGKN